MGHPKLDMERGSDSFPSTATGPHDRPHPNWFPERLGVALTEPASVTRAAFGELVELRRREQARGIHSLARAADVEVNELLAIEGGLADAPEPRTVFMLAQVLRLPVDSLMALSGLIEMQDWELHLAATRFLIRERPATELRRVEKAALQQLLRILM